MITDVLRNVSLFVDGRGYAGKIEMVQLPKLAVKTEEFRAGGMDAPVKLDQGLEALDCTIELAAVDKALLQQWGVSVASPVPLTIRGALQSEDGAVTAVVVNLRGTVTEVDWGDWKPGEKAPLKATVNCRYYKLEHGGEVVHEIDVENMVRIVNGTDQLAAQRTALGI